MYRVEDVGVEYVKPVQLVDSNNPDPSSEASSTLATFA